MMCNLYNHTRSVDAMRGLFSDLDNHAGNLEPGDVYPDQLAPIVTLDGSNHRLRMARWGMPSPHMFHSKSGIDRGVTNVRNTSSPHWRRWLKPENRCLVPFHRFAEPRMGKGAGNAWFSFADDRAAFFAGIWIGEWTSIRKLKDGATADDLFAFLTCDPNTEVAEVHPKAMPVILTEAGEWATWLTESWANAKQLQRGLPDGSLLNSRT